MKRKTHEEFLEQVKDRPFTVIGKYIGLERKIEFRCKVCDHVWLAQPNNILAGQGCSECGRRMSGVSRRSFTEDEFFDAIKDRHITVVGEFKSPAVKALFRCDTCGYEWEQKPWYVFHGTGCRQCAQRAQFGENIILSDHGSWIEVDISTPASPNAAMQIDMVDWNYLKSLGTGRVYSGRCGYPGCRLKGKHAKVHRILIPDSDCVDHIDRNRANNRRDNLRACSKTENLWNVGVRVDNSTGVRGVNLNDGMFVARISVHGKRLYLGRFDSLEAAAEARRLAELKYHGRFAE